MTTPENLPYTISGRELVAETDGLRVQVLTLGLGEKIPWHYHSAVSDIFICLEGTMVVETRAPKARHQLDAWRTLRRSPQDRARSHRQGRQRLSVHHRARCR